MFDYFFFIIIFWFYFKICIWVMSSLFITGEQPEPAMQVPAIGTAEADLPSPPASVRRAVCCGLLALLWAPGMLSVWHRQCHPPPSDTTTFSPSAWKMGRGAPAGYPPLLAKGSPKLFVGEKKSTGHQVFHWRWQLLEGDNSKVISTGLQSC